jgi:phage terminase large subunit GpA-like protein
MLVARWLLQGSNPPPKLTISQWADRERIVSPPAAEPGRWRTQRAEYQRGVMDALGDPRIPIVTVMKGSQLGFTELLLNACGFWIHQDPTSLLMIQPNIENAEAWSRERFSPMLRDTPALFGKVRDPRARDTNTNTLRQKVFPGGQLSIIGANAPAGLAMRPIRVVLADEVDRYPSSAGDEGDPLALASVRQRTFWNKKTLIGSTPVHKMTSVVYREWEKSDKRRYFVPCHACGHYQPLIWANVRWEKDENGEHLADTAHYVCEACGALWSNNDRLAAVRRGEWRAERPFAGVAGFHMPGLLSPWVSLRDIVKDFLQARRDPQLLQVWVNTALGEPWEETNEKFESSALYARGEPYDHQSLPDAVRLLTAGLDVQINRVELQIVGFGAQEECWVARYEIVHGDPVQPGIWDIIDKLLLEPYHTDAGRVLRVRAACIDTGGHLAASVFDFCKPRRARRIFPIKGSDGPRPIWPKRASITKLKQHEIFLIGVDTAKDVLYGRLRISHRGPGFVHFPVGLERVYYDQLTSERVETRKREGRPYRVWVLPSGARNEALDTFVYALAARYSIPIKLGPTVEIKADPVPAQPNEADEVVETTDEVVTQAVIKPANYWQKPKDPFIPRRNNWFA